MAVSTRVAESNADAPKYARFSRRLRGIAIDFMLFTVAMVAALQVAIALNSDDLARVIGFGFVAGFFLYEPLLVSFAGGTIGHYLSNLRVVDDRTNGNVSLPKAVARVTIKAVLSWYSFISMAAARRQQAVHDLLTRSTVEESNPPYTIVRVVRVAFGPFPRRTLANEVAVILLVELKQSHARHWHVRQLLWWACVALHLSEREQITLVASRPGRRGFSTASQLLYGRPLASLSLAEAATVVAMYPSPNSYLRNSEASAARRDWLLSRLQAKP